MWDAAAMQDAASTNAKQARRPFDAVLCDLDGVLRVWDEDETAGLEAEYDLLPGTVAAVAFDPARLLPAVLGTIGDEEWRTSVAAAFVPAQGIEVAADLVSRWSASIGRVDKPVLALVDATRRAGVPVLIATNATTRLESDLAALGLDSAVDGVVSSARIGAVKPNSDFYLAAALRAGTPPERCLFVDDTRANVDGAIASGMQAVHYSGVESLRAVLSPVLA
jgi:putative hydrolase of the HAD superfamily